MRAVGLAVGLAFAGAEVQAGPPRGYAGALAVPAGEGAGLEPAPAVAATPSAVAATPSAVPRRDAVTPDPTGGNATPSSGERPPPPRPVAHPSGLSGRRLAMQRVGVAAVVLGAGGWIATIVGLGLGSAADSDIAPLRARDEIDRRRELLDRGRLANRLALGAGISAAAMLAVGVALLAVARRQRSRSAATQARAAR